MSLRFTPGNHTYRLDGKPVPSVTGLIGKGLPKDKLMYWSARTVAEYVADNPEGVESLRSLGRGPMVNALKGIPWEKRDAAAVRGTDVHALAEQLIHGAEAEVPEHLYEYVRGYADFLDAWQPTPIITERSCASREWWYAGTLDAIVELPSGERLLLDWKTSASVYGDVSVQLAAYRGAEFYLTEDGEEAALPHVDGLAVVHITPTQTDLYRIADPESAWRDWLHIAWVAKSRDRLKSQISEPAEAPEWVAS